MNNWKMWIVAAVFGKSSLPAGDIGLINFYFWIYTHFINKNNNNNILNSDVLNCVVRSECLNRMGKSSLIRLNSSNGSFGMWNRLKCHITIKIATLINCECVEMLMANGIWKWTGIRNSKHTHTSREGMQYSSVHKSIWNISKTINFFQFGNENEWKKLIVF